MIISWTDGLGITWPHALVTKCPIVITTPWTDGLGITWPHTLVTKCPIVTITPSTDGLGITWPLLSQFFYQLINWWVNLESWINDDRKSL